MSQSRRTKEVRSSEAARSAHLVDRLLELLLLVDSVLLLLLELNLLLLLNSELLHDGLGLPLDVLRKESERCELVSSARL